MNTTERLRFALQGPRDTECNLCGHGYNLRSGQDATVFCDACAQKLADDILPPLLAVAEAAEKMLSDLGRYQRREMVAGGQTVQACLGRTFYVKVPVTIDAELSSALAELEGKTTT